MTIFGRTSALLFTPCACLMLSSVMPLSVVNSPRCMAQDDAHAEDNAHAESPKKIKSWLAEPGMTQEDENRLIEWIESRPKATHEVATIQDFAEALRATVPEEKPFEISINLRALEEIGIEPDTSLFANSIPVGSNLLSHLRQYDLAYNIRNGAIEITSHDSAEADPSRRIYDVTCLLSASEEDGKRTVNFGELLVSIQSTVQPDQWEALGGTSTIVPLLVNQRCLLIVSTNSDMHLSIQSLLDGLVVAGQVTTDEFTKSEVPLTLKNEPSVSLPPNHPQAPGAQAVGGMF